MQENNEKDLNEEKKKYIEIIPAQYNYISNLLKPELDKYTGILNELEEQEKGGTDDNER